MPLLWSLPWTTLLVACFISNLQLISKPVQAYVPAVPANSSSTPGLAGLDVTDNSTVLLTWNPNGSYSTVVSYQSAGSDSKGISKGVLLRTSEDDLRGRPVETSRTSTPWIALINCDKNSTNNDLDEDIFSKVADRGAIAAVLYSNTSDGCLMNDEYLSVYDHLFDIFTAKKPSVAILIQSVFNNINYSFTHFDPVLLNNSAESVAAALPRSASNTSPFIIASLRAANATGEEDPNDPAPVPTTIYSPSTNHSSGPSQSLAMIILYVIVSLVSALFIVVILSGAIRAFRHPERYGPRLYDPGYDGDDAAGRTRAQGVTQAILDTFPIVKFGRGNTNTNANDLPYARNQRMEMKDWNRPASGASHVPTESMGQFLSPNAKRQSGGQNQDSQRNLLAVSDGSPTPPRASSEAGHAEKTNRANVTALIAAKDSASSPTNSTRPGDAENVDDTLDPAAIGRETCPICIVDFEEGDDLRVLPCEGHHRFHKDCVDPWLLELSTSCPICREDFQALVNMAAANEEEEQEQERAQNPRGADVAASSTGPSGSRGSSRAGSSHRRGHSDRDAEEREDDEFPEDRKSTHGSRFSKYIRFAQKRRRRSLREQAPAVPAPAPAPQHHPEQSAYPSI